MTAQQPTRRQAEQTRRIICDARRVKPNMEVVAMFFSDDGADLWIDLHPQGRYVVSREGWWRPPRDPVWQPPAGSEDVQRRFRRREKAR